MRSLKEMMDMAGRVSLVTGGGGHIGSAMCDGLAELGSAVVVLDRDAGLAAETAARCKSVHGVEALPLCVDLADATRMGSVPRRITDRFGHLDVLVNCAMFTDAAPMAFHEESIEGWSAAMSVDLTAPFLLVQACAQALSAQEHGCVVNVSSIYGMLGPDMGLYEGTGMTNVASYAAAKGGLLQLTRYLSTVLAPKIRVNAISPGGVERGQLEIFQERYVRRTPLERMGVEEDLKGAVAYLASDLSAYVTGHNLVVDGGWSAW